VDEKIMKIMTIDYYINGEIIYTRSFDMTFLRCLNEKEVEKALLQVNERVCATHTNRHTMVKQMQRSGYF
jgi:hypothetical protein